MPPKPPEEFLSGTTTVYETGTIESSTTTPIYSSPKRTPSKRRTTNSSTSPYKALIDSTTPPQLHNEHNSNNTVNFVVNNDNNNINGVSSSILTNNLTTLTLSNNDSSSSNSSRVEAEYVISPYQKKLAPSTRRRSFSKQDPSSFYSLPPTITPIPTINAKSSNIIDSGHYNLNLKSIDIGSNDGTTTIRPRQQSKDSGTPKVVSDNNIISYVKSILSYINLEIIKFIVLCLLWYASSAITNNIGKQILNQFNYPLTLTWIQFGFVAFYCYLFGNGVGFTKLEPPSRQILIKTLPLSLFSIIGHVFSSYATSRVPVSFVHTIKALSPLFTVFFYRFGFKVNYSSRVYISLLPLTIGVMLACSSSTTSNFIGFLFALGSTVIFVAQNIFSKNILFNQNNSIGLRNLKLDELNVSFYSSLLAFILMYPIWLYYEGSTLIFNHWWIDSSVSSSSPSSSNSWIIVFYFWLNGSSHFAQNILALSILSITSPVTYSIASLVKRIFVITASIIWFGQKTSFIQGIGITLTFWGLYMYNQAKKDVERKERKATEDEIILPITSKTR